MHKISEPIEAPMQDVQLVRPDTTKRISAISSGFSFLLSSLFFFDLRTILHNYQITIKKINPQNK